MPIKVNALDHLVVNVTDAEKSAVWYERVLLHCKIAEERTRVAPFLDQKIFPY